MWSMGQNKGGPALTNVLKGYVQSGWKVVFITGNGGAENQNLDGIRIVRFDAPGLKRLFPRHRWGAVARALWWLVMLYKSFSLGLKLNSEFHFDVIYGYEIWGIPAARLLSLVLHIPMVSRFQGTSFGVGWENKRLKFLRAWDHWIALSTPADLIIMTNDGTQGDRVLREVGANMDKVRFWMNGTDKEVFSNPYPKETARQLLNIQAGHVLLMVSRLIWWKCVDRGIRILPEVLKVFPDTILLIIGEGDEQPKLQLLVEELGLTKNVQFMGSIPQREIATYMAAADVFLSLYTWSNVGNPLLEAMLSGKCIVTISNGDTPQFINDGVTGFLFAESDLTGLPMKVIQLLANPFLASEVGDAARQYAYQNFPTWEERVSREINEVNSLRRSTPAVQIIQR